MGTVTVTDPDAGDTLSYSITGGNTGNAFAINSRTGQITVNNADALDFETTPSFTLTVQVRDAGGLTDTATATIDLTNVNEVPTVNSTAFSLPENSANGTVVGTVTATDPDAGDALTYLITGGQHRKRLRDQLELLGRSQSTTLRRWTSRRRRALP